MGGSGFVIGGRLPNTEYAASRHGAHSQNTQHPASHSTQGRCVQNHLSHLCVSIYVQGAARSAGWKPVWWWVLSMLPLMMPLSGGGIEPPVGYSRNAPLTPVFQRKVGARRVSTRRSNSMFLTARMRHKWAGAGSYNKREKNSCAERGLVG